MSWIFAGYGSTCSFSLILKTIPSPLISPGTVDWAIGESNISPIQGWTCDPVTAKEQVQHLLRLLRESKVLFLTGLDLGVHFAIQTSCYQKYSLSEGGTNMEEARPRDDTRSS